MVVILFYIVVLRAVPAPCREVSVTGSVVLQEVSARCREVSGGGGWSCEKHDYFLLLNKDSGELVHTIVQKL